MNFFSPSRRTNSKLWAKKVLFKRERKYREALMVLFLIFNYSGAWGLRNRDRLKRMFNCQKTKVLILFETRDHLAFLYSGSYFSDPFILALLTKDYRASFSIMRAKCHYAPTHPASTLILRIMRMLKPPLSHSSMKLCFNLKGQIL